MGIEYYLPGEWIEFLRENAVHSEQSSKMVDIYFSNGLFLMNVEILDCTKFYFRNERLNLDNIEKIIVKDKCREN